jgi:hypothetical protein
VDSKLLDIKIRNYLGIIIPCMAAGDSPRRAPDTAVELVKKSIIAGKLVAAEHSLELLRPTGLMTGRKVAGNAAMGIVRDKNLITSFNCPEQAGTKEADTIGLTNTFIAAISGK